MSSFSSREKTPTSKMAKQHELSSDDAERPTQSPAVNEFLKNSMWNVPAGEIQEVDGFDVSDLAYVVDFLNGDGDPFTSDDHDQAWNEDDTKPLWEMIRTRRMASTQAAATRAACRPRMRR